MPTLLLAGAYGQGNPGDEALLSSFIRQLESWDIIATSADPFRTESDHGCRAITPSARAVAAAAASADAVVVGGGTIFKQLHDSTHRPPMDLLRKTFLLVTGARAVRKPVALVGVGAAPLGPRTARLFARTIMHMADLVVLRDEESAALLADAGVAPPMWIGADPAWTLLDSSDPGLSRDKIVIAVSHYAGDPNVFAEALRPLADECNDILVQPWQPLEDLEVASAIHDALGRSARLIEPPSSLQDAKQLFASARLVVGMRFHALVAAGAAQTPFCAIAHEPKLVAIARRLGQVWVDPLLGSDAIGEAALRALWTPAPSADAVDAQIVAAHDGFRMLQMVLSGGESDADLARPLALTQGPQPWHA